VIMMTTAEGKLARRSRTNAMCDTFRYGSLILMRMMLILITRVVPYIATDGRANHGCFMRCAFVFEIERFPILSDMLVPTKYES
jgi:hypothetical protein